MSNGEVFIVAKPHFERTNSGQNEISIVDVWIVPDNGQGPVPSNIDDRRAGEAPRCNVTQEPQRLYQPLTSQFLNNSFQHMTLVRTNRGWEIQPDIDQRATRYNVPRMIQEPVEQRYAPGIFRGGNCGCNSERPAYMEPRPQFRVQIEQPYASVDPRYQFRVQTNPQYRAEDPRVSQFNYQRQYQIELQRMPDAELQRRYEILMERRQTERERMLPQKINPRLPEAEYKRQYQLEIQRRNEVEVQRKVDAELQRTFEVEMRRRINQQRTQTQGEWNTDPQDDLQRRTEAELRRRYEVEMQRRYDFEMQRRYADQQQQELPRWTQTTPQNRTRAPQARPQGRATYGVDPSIGLTLERRNQQMRQEVDQFEGGLWNPRPSVPQGRARYGVDQRTGAEMARRDSAVRDQTSQLDDEIFNRPPAQQQYRPQYQYAPQAQGDPTRWQPRAGNLRSWEDNLDFDPDGTKIRENVGKYLGRYGPTNQPTRNPNGVYGPSPLSPQGMIEGSVDSTLRSWGNYIRGK